MTMARTILLALALAAAHASPKAKMSMRTRSRTISEEVKGRVSRYEQHAKAHAPAAAQQFMSADTASSTMPDHTSTAFWGYPMTLDYVVDVAFATDFHTYKEYPVIVDTGSSNLAMAVSECSNCGDGATDLDVTLDESECIEVTYGSGAWSGYETSVLSVGFVEGTGGVLADNVTMAAITTQEDFFEGDGYNGILGLAYADLMEPYSASECSSSSSSQGGGMGGGGGGGQSRSSRKQAAHSRAGARASPRRQLVGPNGDGSPPSDAGSGSDGSGSGSTSTSSSSSTAAAVPLLDSMYDDGMLHEDVFSLAFCSNDAAFAVGGVNTSDVAGNVTYVDVEQTYGMFYGYYLVYLESVGVDGETISGVSENELNWLGGVLVDSGTTLLYLPSAAASAIETKVKSVASANGVSLSGKFFEWMAAVSADDLQYFPTVSLNLKGYTLELTPRDYLLHYDTGYYWGISSSSVGIIGNIALQNKMVVFDREQNKVGFGDAKCGSGSGVVADASLEFDDDATTDDASSAASSTASKTSTSSRPRKAALAVQAPAAAASTASARGANTLPLLGAGALVVAAALGVARRRRTSAQYLPIAEAPEALDA